ncbi:Uncharacterized protein dnm_036020 [Desulfonema magnum]|uniref:Uncharacterized protein n=1 Tax=Desulfonema magnum TaxID=45655 RepID=A0A975GP55_9BACT|nr:Uncharacterized protein dnm_036020 [Desulfonema magnum]
MKGLISEKLVGFQTWIFFDIYHIDSGYYSVYIRNRTTAGFPFLIPFPCNLGNRI